MSQKELIIEHESFTLSEFLTEIKLTLDKRFKGSGGFWVTGELSEWRKHSIHYYGEIVEYDDEGKNQIAKARLNLWGFQSKKIINNFKGITGENIKAGIKVLLLVEVNCHPLYGLSLNIIDIDPSFTLGDREARRKLIIKELIQKGIIERNKQLPTPKEFTNIAIISSDTAAGLGDFFSEAKHLQSFGLCNFSLFQALMQGKECASSVANQFRAIYKEIQEKPNKYDVIILIRGGGSQSDLDSFNYIEPAIAICSMQIPVFVGIGHERDKTVLDEIAHTSFDTPSKVIKYIEKTITDNAIKAKNDLFSILDTANYQASRQKQYLLEQLNSTHQLVIHTVKTSKDKITTSIDKIYVTAKNNISNGKRYSLYEYDGILKYTKNFIFHHSEKTKSLMKNTITTSQAIIQYTKRDTQGLYQYILNTSSNTINSMKHKITMYYRGILALSIEPTLDRGFSITQSLDGKYITSAKQAQQYQSMIITYHDGKILTEIKHD